MDSLRRWLNKPRVDDKSLLARFYHADKALTAVANELDSFDGRSEPERCSRLVSKLRQEQDRVLGIINLIMDELLGDDRACRAFRAKFPEEVLQESLAGQLWFGAECLSAGSAILNREAESAEMRPLAKAVTKSLDNVRNQLRDQCLRNNTPNSTVLKLDLHDQSTENLYESLKIFDRLFSDFELQYVSAMVQVKTKQEHETQELICVLFSEALQRALKHGILHQDQVDTYDPSLMFSIPRLAIIAGLIIYDEGPLNLSSSSDHLSEMFRPFRKLLIKMRDYLKTLNKQELYQLEMLLCTNEEINLTNQEQPQKQQYDDFKSKLNEKVKDERVHKMNVNKSSEWVNEDTDVADDEAEDEAENNIQENVANGDCPTGFLVSNTSLGNLLQTNGTTLTYNIIPRTEGEENETAENDTDMAAQRDSGIGTGDTGSLDRTPEDENAKILTGNYDENWENLRKSVEPSTSATQQRPASESNHSRSCKERTYKKRSRKHGYHYNHRHHHAGNESSSASPCSSNSASSSPASTGSCDSKDLTKKTKFRSTENLLHRLFVCIAGVADQLQTNFASDLRQILRAVFLINCSQDEEEEVNEPETVGKKNSIDAQDLFEFRPGEENVIRNEGSNQNSIGSQQSICSAEEVNPESDDAVFEEDDDEANDDNDMNTIMRAGNRCNGRSVSLSDDATASPSLPIENSSRRTVSTSVSTSYPQSPPKWLPDSHVAKCMSCDAVFTAFKRRHHCRNCGGIFCASCSSSQTPLPQFGLTKPVRVCKQCMSYVHDQIASPSASSTQTA